MNLKFEKWHGCKNDFIIVWMLESQRSTMLKEVIKKAPSYCDRSGSGVSADGILVLMQPNEPYELPKELVIINADGSIAKNCGNGLRVAALSVRKACFERPRFPDAPDSISLTVEDRVFDMRYLLSDEKQKYPFVAIEMGRVLVNEDNAWHKEALSFFNESFSEADVSTIDVGNKHIVISTETFDEDTFIKLGQELQEHKAWDGINFHWAIEKEQDEQDHSESKRDLLQSSVELYETYCFERGVGPTQACGSGACAVGIHATKHGFASLGDWVGVKMPGGKVYVMPTEEGVTLAGPGQYVYQGEISL